MGEDMIYLVLAILIASYYSIPKIKPNLIDELDHFLKQVTL
jgi:hypothetical protein